MSFEPHPALTIAEACQRIAELTGVRCPPTQVRQFLKGLDLKWQRVRAIPVPPKNNLDEHAADQAVFYDECSATIIPPLRVVSAANVTSESGVSDRTCHLRHATRKVNSYYA